MADPEKDNSNNISNSPSAKPDPSSEHHTFIDRVSHFTWTNFASTMSTGSIAVLLSQQPYTFRGLRTIGKIFFILDLIMFVAFNVIIILRFRKRPWKFSKSLHWPPEALFFGTYWVSIALILTCIQQYGIPACGSWLVKVMEVLFWLYAASALLVAIFQYLTLFVAEKTPVSSAVPAWVFPVYPLLVIGPLAGVMVPDQPPSAALTIFIGAVCFQGLAWTVAMFMYTTYFIRLMAADLPTPPTRPGMFVSVGPAGYTATALVSLGSKAPDIIPEGFLGLRNFQVGAVVKVIGVFSGLFVFLIAFWFFALALCATLEGARRMSFNLNWWAFIFPNAGMVLAALQIGDVLDSTGIKAVCSAVTLLLVVTWLGTSGAYINAVRQRQLYWRGKDEDDGMEGDD
jgi:C4-dicarboxylate transporter/malic acid transport protein